MTRKNSRPTHGAASKRAFAPAGAGETIRPQRTRRSRSRETRWGGPRHGVTFASGLWDLVGMGLPEGCCPRGSRSHLVPPSLSAPPVRTGRYPTRRGVSLHPRKGRRGQVEDPQVPQSSAGRSTPGSTPRSAGGRATTRTSHSRTGSPPCFGALTVHHISGRFVTCEKDSARRQERLGQPPCRRAAGGALPEATKRGVVGGNGNESVEGSSSHRAVASVGEWP